MRVIYHLGAHCTDEGRLLRVLLKNLDLLSHKGIIVPGPSRYRRLIQTTIRTLEGAPPTSETQEAILDAIVDEDHIERLIVSSQDFLAFAPWTFTGKTLYCKTEDHIQALTGLLPDSSVEFFLALRNPATFIPAVYSRTNDMPFDEFLRGTDPVDMRWSDLVQRMRNANADAPITIWCNEDTPLIWRRVLDRLTGLEPDTPLIGESDFLAEILAPDGMSRYLQYLEQNPPQNDAQRMEILTAFLDKFAIPEKLEEELDFPDWSADLVSGLTKSYEQDIGKIKQISGVTFLAP